MKLVYLNSNYDEPKNGCVFETTNELISLSDLMVGLEFKMEQQFKKVEYDKIDKEIRHLWLSPNEEIELLNSLNSVKAITIEDKTAQKRAELTLFNPKRTVYPPVIGSNLTNGRCLFIINLAMIKKFRLSEDYRSYEAEINDIWTNKTQKIFNTIKKKW